MNTKPLIIGLVTAAIFFTLAILAWKTGGAPSPQPFPSSKPILFYGIGCPHCKIVEDFLTENPTIQPKLGFDRLEVYKNRENALLMRQRAQTCNIPEQGMGVPMYWNGTRCYQGDKDIIDLFRASSGATTSTP